MFYQVVEFKITQRVNIQKILELDTQLIKDFTCPGMNRENDGDFPYTLYDVLNQQFQFILLIDIGWTVQGHHKVFPCLKTELFPDCRLLEFLYVGKQSIDHRVTHEEDSLFCNPFLNQIPVGGFRCGEEEITDTICGNPIDLLRHGPIPGTNTTLYMGYLDTHFLCHD